MQDNEHIDADYLKGFNQGYIFNQYEPSFAKTIEKSIGNSEMGIGFKDGIAEWERNKDDLLKTKDDLDEFQKNASDITGDNKPKQPYVPKWLRSDRLNNFNKQQPGRDVDKEKD